MINVKEMQTVQTLFGDTSNIQYRIPIYQRRYVWDSLNWKSLWTDINENMEADEENIKQIFAGIIVTRQQKKQSDTEIYDVIDGQQRLTTFQIILCLIRRHILSNGWKDHRKIISGVDRLMKYGEDENLQNKLWPKETSDDEKAFQALVKWDTDIPDKQDDEHVLLRAYRYFKEQIEPYSYDEMHKLYKIITLSIAVAQINVTDEDESEMDVTPEKVFASLNATGRMLSEFDYLRNDLFLRALRAGKNSVTFYQDPTYWHSSFEKDNTSELDDFLRDFLKANLKSRFQSGKKLFEVYQQDYRSQSNLNIEEEFMRLSAYAQVYEDINNPASELNRHMQFYKDLNLQIPSLTSFLLFVKLEAKLSDTEPPKIYRILESYIIRRILKDGRDCYASIFEGINGYFSEVIECPSPSNFTVNALAQSLSNKWPDDITKVFKHASISEIFRYVFYRIELKLRNDIEKSTSSFSFDEIDTLVHIVSPEELSKSSTMPSDQQELNQLMRESTEAVYSLGNMAVLTKRPQKTWIDKDFKVKQDCLREELAPDLVLTKKICGFTDWNIEQIRKRTEELISVFIEIWPSANTPD